MSEIFGEREGTRRMTNMVLQSQASWGAIERVDNGKRILRRPTIEVVGELTVVWLVEACIRYLGRPISLASIEAMPVIFPFKIVDGLPHKLATAPTLEIRSFGVNKQVVDLK
jgi:hypothetical protein